MNMLSLTNRALGKIGLIGAPFLLIGFYTESQIKSLEHSWFTGLWGVVYMTGWLASLIGLQQMQATGQSLIGRLTIWLALGALILANISNIWQLVDHGPKPPMFFALDLFWPLSNVLMLPVGIMVIVAKRLNGWRRYVPLVVGLWFLVCILTLELLGRDGMGLLIGGGYSAVAWFGLAYIVLTSRAEPTEPTCTATVTLIR